MAVDKGAEGGVVIVELDVAVDGEGDDELFEVGEVVDEGEEASQGAWAADFDFERFECMSDVVDRCGQGR